MKTRRTRRAVAAVAASIAALAAPIANAVDTFTWTGRVQQTSADPAGTAAALNWDASSAGATNWSLVSTNASGGVTGTSANAVPAPATATRLAFGPTAAAAAGHLANATPNQDLSTAGFTLNAVAFADANGAAASSYALNGGPLMFATDPATGAAPSIAENTAVGQTINETLILADTLTLTGSSYTGVVTINGSVRPSAPPTAMGLDVDGSATYLLNGSNSFGGGVSITAGTLRVGNGAALPVGGVPLTMTGGTLDLSPLAAGTPVRLGDLAVNAGTLNLGAAALTVGAYASGRAYGSITGAGSLTKAGADTLLLGGSNSYAGGTTIAAGVLAVVSTQALGTAGPIRFAGGTLSYGTSSLPDYSPRISTAANQPVSIDLGGNAVTYAAGVNSSGGSLKVDGSSGSLTLPSAAAAITTGDLTVTGGASLVTTGGPVTLSGGLHVGGYNLPAVKPVGGTLSADTIEVGDGVGSGGLYPSGTAITANRITVGGAVLAGNGGSPGYLNLSNGATATAASMLSIGNADTGYMLLSNGTASAAAVILGAGTARSTVYVVSGGTLNASAGGVTLCAGGSPAGAALGVQTGGTVTSAGPLALNGSAAAVTLQGGRITAGDLYGVAGSTLTLAVPTGGGPAVTVGSDNRTTTFAGTLSGSGTLAKVGTGTLRLPLTASVTTIAFNVSGGGAIELPAGTVGGGIHADQTGAIAVAGAGTSLYLTAVAAPADRSLLVAPSVSATNGGRLDVGNNDVDLTGQSLAAVTALAATGFNGGRWTGPGIASATAAGDAAHLTAVGVIVNGSLYPVFDGRHAATTDVLVRYTLYGDTNLDGAVTAADYTRADAGFVNHLTGWANGDANYDGVVDGSDYSLIDNAFNRQAAGTIAAPAVAVADAPVPVSVPEPAAVGAAGGLLVLGARRRPRKPRESR